jgi:hypothetical protein
MVSTAATAQPQQQREMLTQNADRLRRIGNRIQVILRAGTGTALSAELINLIYALARLAISKLHRGYGYASPGPFRDPRSTRWTCFTRCLLMFCSSQVVF